jgi:hypothetical protein
MNFEEKYEFRISFYIDALGVKLKEILQYCLYLIILTKLLGF